MESHYDPVYVLELALLIVQLAKECGIRFPTRRKNDKDKS